MIKIVEPLVSIIIPVFNRESLVLDAIDSALNQTYKNIEIIVIDNKSLDNTWRNIQKYKIDKRIKLFQNSSNIGPVLNWKRGIEYSSGKYVKLLFSDDMIAPNYIQNSIKCFDESCAFVFSDIRLLVSDKLLRVQSFFKTKYTTFEYMRSVLSDNIEGFPVSPGAALYRRKDVIDSLICSNIPNESSLESLKNGAGNDLLIYLLLCNKYPHIKKSRNTYVDFRIHDGSFSVRENLDHYYLWAKIYFVKNIYCGNHMVALQNALLYYVDKRLKVSKQYVQEKNAVSAFKFSRYYYYHYFFLNILQRLYRKINNFFSK